MAKRKSLTKKTRFEVFKRDKFTCQYCGQKAPNVVLQVDHIYPVARGGNNDIFNLTTSCQLCNSGKQDGLLIGLEVTQRQVDSIVNTLILRFQGIDRYCVENTIWECLAGFANAANDNLEINIRWLSWLATWKAVSSYKEWQNIIQGSMEVASFNPLENQLREIRN